MSAGILSGCNSAPPLATPKGEFVDMNTDITTLLPQIKPVYMGDKIATVSNQSLVNHASKTVNKNITGSGKTVVENNSGASTRLLAAKPLTNKPVELKGYTAPVATVASNTPVKLDSAGKTNALIQPVSLTKSKNPFSGDTSPHDVKNGTVKPVIAPVPLPISPIVKPVKHWDISKGSTLKTVFNEWAAKEKCNASKSWSVQWNTDTDYQIDSPLTFTGNFEEVTLKLFSLYINANAPLYADGYKSQCLIVISESAKNRGVK